VGGWCILLVHRRLFNCQREFEYANPWGDDDKTRRVETEEYKYNTNGIRNKERTREMKRPDENRRKSSMRLLVPLGDT